MLLVGKNTKEIGHLLSSFYLREREKTALEIDEKERKQP